MGKYYEIVRFANQWPEMEEYETIEKLIRRGWYRKAIEYMSQWDYGDENISAAIARGETRDSVLDETKDSVLYERDGYSICSAHCPSGLYDAYYLVAAIPEEILETI